MTNIMQFTDKNFQSEVLNSNQLILVDFWAAWCAPCRAIAPAIEELADDFANVVKVGKLNIDDHPQTPQELGINSIPAVLLMQNGKVLETFVGIYPKDHYAKAIQNALNHATV